MLPTLLEHFARPKAAYALGDAWNDLGFSLPLWAIKFLVAIDNPLVKAQLAGRGVGVVDPDR